jgi:hypothetical protein
MDAHLRAMPADGTVLEGLPSERFWVIEQGRRKATSPKPGAVQVTDSAVRSLLAWPDLYCLKRKPDGTADIHIIGGAEHYRGAHSLLAYSIGFPEGTSD